MPAQLLRAACVVGDRLCDLALYSEHGANWIGLTYVNEREWALLPSGADLYGGAGGIALFLAYLGEVTGCEKYTDCARAALAYTHEVSNELQKHMKTLGGYGGWGGMLYLYSHLATLWQDRTLLTAACQLAELIPELAEQDELFDVIGGSAGCIAGLLSLYRVEPAAVILQAACACGERLLAAAPQCSRERSTNLPPPLTGFSHGAAGIALNLLRLAHASGEERFREGASVAMEYGRQTFSPEKQNWPDFRQEHARKKPQDGMLEYMLAWCHGAPGIGLARLASLPYCDDEQLYTEIEKAVNISLAQGFGMNHSLCHGDLGNLETVFSAARVLRSSHYQAEFERRANTLLVDIEQSGWKTGIPLSVESPGLMMGIAGIGYELLRLAAPEQVPSVLVLEPPYYHPAP